MDKQMNAAHELREKTVALLVAQVYQCGARYEAILTCAECNQNSMERTRKTQALANEEVARDAECSGWIIKDGKPLCHNCHRKLRTKAKAEVKE